MTEDTPLTLTRETESLRLTRREALGAVAGATAATLLTRCAAHPPEESAMTPTPPAPPVPAAASADPQPVRETTRLGGIPWPTADPFLFCAYHVDHYPQGAEDMGPAATLAGRRIGSDFSNRDGWSMYHGQRVPGFPQHPHRGFETVTVTRSGLIDQADSMGATARYGDGDVQWMTAGRGISHAEMFPLLDKDAPNRTEIFQIWLNLPAADKMAPARFAMFWDADVPRVTHHDDAGRQTQIRVIAGALEGARPPSPPPDSWAAKTRADVAIWTIVMAPGAVWTLPAAGPQTTRTLYVFGEGGVHIGATAVATGFSATLKDGVAAAITAGDKPVQLLLLQGRPIGEPVAHRGPFVMNTQEELRQAMVDYQRGAFGGWPWDGPAPVHPRTAGRFARHADGHEEKAPA